VLPNLRLAIVARLDVGNGQDRLGVHTVMVALKLDSEAADLSHSLWQAVARNHVALDRLVEVGIEDSADLDFGIWGHHSVLVVGLENGRGLTFFMHCFQDWPQVSIYITRVNCISPEGISEQVVA
jgi:hypothetical protein